MKPSERRAEMKKEMGERIAESYNNRDDSGRFKSIFTKEKMTNAKWWKCAEDEHFINIIPYIGGPNNPNGKAGKWAYNLDIWVHRKVGVTEDNFICLARSYGKACPICEHQAEERKKDNYNEDFVKSLNPTRRVIYNIVCLDNNTEVAKGIQLFDVAHWLFEKYLAELAKIPRSGGFILFSDSDVGKTVFFRKKGSGATNTSYTAFAFHDRTEPISDALLDSAHSLDDMIYIPTYAEVYKAHWGSSFDESDGDRVITTEVLPDNSQNEDVTDPVSHDHDAGTFECPGNPPEDFGKFEVCEKCPDLAECEKEFQAFELELAAAEKVAAEKAAAPKVDSPLARRRAALEHQSEPEPSAAPIDPVTPTKNVTDSLPPGRQLRRRPGQ